MIVVSDNASSIILKPGEQPFNFPTPDISTQCSSILRRWFSTISAVWRNELNFLSFQPFIQRIAIIGKVSDDALWLFFDKSFLNCLFHQFYFVGTCSGGPYGDRKARSVCDCHDLGAFTFLSFSNIKPPFLALAKVPSMKHSVMSIFPRSLKSLAITHKALSHTPDFTQFWKYR